MSVCKVILKAGLLSWLSDKKSIRKRFIYWPIAIPLVTVGFMALALTIITLRAGEGGGLSEKGGVAVAIEKSEYSDSIKTVLSKSPTNYTVLIADKDQLKSLVENNSATFYLEVNKTDSTLSLTLGYDSNRNYPHKNWIDNTKSQLHHIVSQIQSDKLASLEVDLSIIEQANVSIDYKLDSFGGGSGNIILVILGYILWAFVFTIALDASLATFYNIFVQDIENDLIPIWLAAHVPKITLLLSRMAVGSCIYLLACLVFFSYSAIFASLYYAFSSWMLTVMDPQVLTSSEIHIALYGFIKLCDNLSLSSIVGLFITMGVLGIFALSCLLYSAMNSSNTEQARTKSKIIETSFSLIPMVGFLAGYEANSNLSLIPLIGLYQTLIDLLANNMTVTNFLVSIGLQVVYLVPILAVQAYLFNSKQRFAGDVVAQK